MIKLQLNYKYTNIKNIFLVFKLAYSNITRGFTIQHVRPRSPYCLRDRESNLPSFGNLRQPRDHLRPSSASSPSQGKRTVSTGTGIMFRAVFRLSTTGARSLAQPRLCNSGRVFTFNIYISRQPCLYLVSERLLE